MSHQHFMTFDIITQWMGDFLTVKALGRVLLHLQCFGRLLQRKLGLSVWTRPLGGAVLRWWRRDLASWSSSWWLAGEGAGRRFTTGSERKQQRHRNCCLSLDLGHIYGLYTNLQHKLIFNPAVNKAYRWEERQRKEGSLSLHFI